MDNNYVEHCYVALELSQRSWLIGYLLPGSKKVQTQNVAGGDTDALLEALSKIASKCQIETCPERCSHTLRVCFEAGYDGFWLARFLIDRDIDTLILDPSSFLVSRRGRRAKTDRIDVEAMVFTLKAYTLGDKSVCRPVRLPSVDEEDAKRLSRERTQLKKERTRHINRVRALLILHGIRSVPGLWGGRWEDWLLRVRTGDGRELGLFIRKELSRQLERLDLVNAQLKALERERVEVCSAANGVDDGCLDAPRDARKKLLTPGLRRNAVSWAIEHQGYSQRRACGLVGIDPRVYRYRSTRPDDVKLRKRLKELASQRRRFGYRRLHLLLKREGVEVNWKKLYRLYREERLTVRKRGGRKRPLGTRAPMTIPQDPNQRWSLDFVSDTLIDGRRFRILCVIDDFSRECLAALVYTFSRFSPVVDPRFIYRGEDVVVTLDQACQSVGYPKTIRVDQGSEFISRDLDLWAYQKDVELDFSRPGKPTDNAFIESFNGKFRSECLNAHWFLTLDDARSKMEEWRTDYNTVRPHSAIGNKPPISLMKGSSAASAL